MGPALSLFSSPSLPHHHSGSTGHSLRRSTPSSRRATRSSSWRTTEKGCYVCVHSGATMFHVDSVVDVIDRKARERANGCAANLCDRTDGSKS